MSECDLKNETCGFRCTGYDGKQVWKKRMDAIKKDTDCESCKDHAIKHESFSHDHVNAGLGKKVFDKKNYHQTIKEILCVQSSCLKDGRC